MCRGAAQALGEVRGICVSSFSGPVPDGLELLLGNHPVPGPESFAAGRKVLEMASTAKGHLIALISGGGSALCEHPLEGVSADYISNASRRLLEHGASIAEINLVRRHLSAVKNGGVTLGAGASVDTYAISDVCGEDPSVIASGPTAFRPLDPDTTIDVMRRHGIEIPHVVEEAIRRPRHVPDDSPISVIADGRTAAAAAVRLAVEEGVDARVADGWLRGDVDEALGRFLETARPGLTVAAGEPDVTVTGDGVGGRNSHAALLAAQRLADTDAVFVAFATDGVDGSSSSAGAMVDGATIERGGHPASALSRSDSATYLAGTDDLIYTGPTGTNVSDIWMLWR